MPASRQEAVRGRLSAAQLHADQIAGLEPGLTIAHYERGGEVKAGDTASSRV
jgi:hypothetical protein